MVNFLEHHTIKDDSLNHQCHSGGRKQLPDRVHRTCGSGLQTGCRTDGPLLLCIMGAGKTGQLGWPRGQGWNHVQASLWDSAPGGSVTRGHQEDHMAGDKASDLRNHSITPSPRCCKAQGGTQSPLGGECPGHCAEGDVGWERPLRLSLRLSLENMASLPRCV